MKYDELSLLPLIGKNGSYLKAMAERDAAKQRQ